MRLAWFFILSTSLHAAALLHPVSFAARGPDRLIPVTLLPDAAEEGAGEAGNGPGGPARVAAPRAPQRAASVAPAKEGSIEPMQPHSDPMEVPPSFTPGNAAFFSTLAKESEADDDKSFNGAGPSAGALAGTGAGKDGFGAGDAGSGAGNGNGGATRAEKPAALSQVRYRDTPRPEYPESARRAGRQGSVLLRVLVDEHGRSKKIEIHQSSGSDALDRAAAEAIRRWRFIPARYGDQPVASWIRIPIDFSLIDGHAR